MRIIGLTGGIGSGKSTVARILEELGARVIDADRVGHEVYRPGSEGFERVVEAFGREVVAPDGTIDRNRLGAKVFGDRERLQQLNSIVHPLIGQEIAERIERFRREDPDRPVVLEAALLVESGSYRMTDEVWVVSTPEDLAIERTETNRGIPREEITRRIGQQTTDEARRRVADVVIENGGSLEDLRARVCVLWQERFSRP